MMILSNLIIIQLTIVVLLMAIYTTATNIQDPTSVLTEISPSSGDEQNPTAVFPNHHFTIDDLPSSSKHTDFTDDDYSSDEEFNQDYPQLSSYNTYWPEIIKKRYVNKIIRGGNSNFNGESRPWAIPYRFGKRAAMPYRFGKRAGMHFRLGKKSAAL